MTVNDVSGAIVDAAIQVHRDLGPGLLESVYETVLAYELEQRSLAVERQASIPIQYRSLQIADAFRADLIVNQQVIVELKSIEQVAPVHKKQLLTYLRLTRMQVGLLLNFGCDVMKSGIHRVANNAPN
ncbi:MAG: GxxExxY protein [Phycisphaeraceae bacterium]|nr:GxxExxY protein [Phycisphaeraceae bacterium]